jgi:integrase
LNVSKQKDAYVFSHDAVGQRRIGDFRKRWQRVCAAAGVPGLYIHDLRRSMARKLRNLGIAESVIMKQAGWKTASMFRRYGIVNDADLELLTHNGHKHPNGHGMDTTAHKMVQSPRSLLR